MSNTTSADKKSDLFACYPVTGEKQVEGGIVPVPLHVYYGHSLFVGGSVDYEDACALFENQSVNLVKTANKRALMGVWVLDCEQSSLGAFKEAWVAFMVSSKEMGELQPHPLLIQKLLSHEPPVRMVSHCFWSDSETMLAYAKEVQGDASCPCTAVVLRDEKEAAKTFSFYKQDASHFVLRGKLTERRRSSVRASHSFLQLVGLRTRIRLSSLPWISIPTVNTIDSQNEVNEESGWVHMQYDRRVLQFFDPFNDYLEFGPETPYHDLDFTPEYIEHLSDIRLVRIPPESCSD